jgi:hypothetical protein
LTTKINASINSVDSGILFHFYFHHDEHSRHEKIRSGYCIRRSPDACITGVSRGKFGLRILSSHWLSMVYIFYCRMIVSKKSTLQNKNANLSSNSAMVSVKMDSFASGSEYTIAIHR